MWESKDPEKQPKSGVNMGKIWYPDYLYQQAPPAQIPLIMPFLLHSSFLRLLSSALLKVSYSMAASSHNANPCYTLSSQFPDQVSYPQEADYEASINSYFYQQARLAPQCIVYPKSASDVSRIVRIIAGMQVKAAIRGGGHTPFASAANIDNAVTIDLGCMNAVSLGTGHAIGVPSFQNDADFSAGPSSSTAAGTVQEMPKFPTLSGDDPYFSHSSQSTTGDNILSADGGATWGDVYRKLDKTGLIAIGGRGTSLGVGGLITGGSFNPGLVLGS